MHPRRVKQTPLDYFQQRVMSSDRRFSVPSYVFYALCQVEEFKIKQKVQVCCDMKMQTGDRNSEYDPKNVHLVLANIRGTLSYWKQYCGSVIAMIHQLGSPTFFLTFSYYDLNSIDALMAMMMNESTNDINFEDIQWDTLDFDQRRKLLDNNFITAARHFNMRVNELFKMMQKLSVELFGRPLIDFTWRVEFQNRGSCHVHSLTFLGNAPAVNTPEYIELIDANISCSISSENGHLARKYQSHRHTATCFKGEKTDCRFGFPRKITYVTTIMGDDGIISNRAVTNEMSIAYYISKYMSKASKQVPSENTQTQLLKQTTKIMSKREVCGQEACYRLCHLPLHKSSRTTVFVPTFKPENRTRVLNKEKLKQGEEELYPNIIENYINRPLNLHDKISEELETNLPAIKLQNNLGFIKLRNKTAVGGDVLNGFQSSLEAFQQYHSQLGTQNDNSIIKVEFIQELNRCLCFLAQMQSQQYSVDDFDDESINEVFEDLEEVEDIVNNRPVSSTATDHLQAISTLSNEQRIVFKKVVNAVCSSVPTGLVVLASEYRRTDCWTKGLALGVEKYGAIAYTSLKGKNLATLRRNYQNLKLIVVDEISMISYEILRVIHLRLCEIFQNSNPFGGILVLLVGDLLQLKPVRGSYVFNQPYKFEHKVHLWRLFEYQELFVTHRQKNDPLLEIYPNATVNEKHVYKDVSKCAGIPSILKLGVGSRVMLLRNKDVAGKLVNGSMGTVRSFECTGLRRNPPINSMELPHAILIQFDDADSHLVQPDGNSKIMPEVFTFPGKNGNMIARKMFPLVESFSVNVHKTQSLSINKAVLDLGKNTSVQVNFTYHFRECGLYKV
ncbi:unnamed protein product [Allacma fusca]|uniref:ATP-dependent DNA helicase n=1 Tax=Allacma fusca TaxID=39272 RepID=A0A8J2PDG5_9HEXA|nr:unnamed protein product [Allacma fusca]